MQAEPQPLEGCSPEHDLVVPLHAAGAGLRLLLETGLVSVDIAALRFKCDLDHGNKGAVRVLLQVDHGVQAAAGELPVPLRAAP